MRHCFFVYGSYSEGHVHYPKISQFIVSEKAGFVRGEIYRMACGFPILNMDNKDSLVPGQIVELEVSENFWSILDPLLGVDMSLPEKSLFHRVTEEVLVENYTKIPAQLYCLNTQKKLKGAHKIEDGNWRRDMTSIPPLTEQLNARHRDYLVRLSKTKGRDIVPIQLDLYRELISLELIVDKGRRLALTHLGKEVSLFLQ